MELLARVGTVFWARGKHVRWGMWVVQQLPVTVTVTVSMTDLFLRFVTLPAPALPTVLPAPACLQYVGTAS